MGLFKRSLLRLFAGILFVVVLVAAIDNSDPVTLKFLDLESGALPVAWWLLGSFLAGWLLSSMFGYITTIGLRKQVRQTNKVNPQDSQKLAQSPPQSPVSDHTA